MKICVEIEFENENVDTKEWLCPANIELALHSYCRNTEFRVREIPRPDIKQIKTDVDKVDGNRFKQCKRPIDEGFRLCTVECKQYYYRSYGE